MTGIVEMEQMIFCQQTNFIKKQLKLGHELLKHYRSTRA